MKQEEQDLLLKSLCGRLPYGVKVLNTAENVNEISLIDSIYFGRDTLVGLTGENDSKLTGIEMIKPYLFPLSSITEEQKNELVRKRLGYYQVFEGIGKKFFFEIGYEVYDWLNEHHFDYRGLIEKGLAIDATNMDVYK